VAVSGVRFTITPFYNCNSNAIVFILFSRRPLTRLHNNRVISQVFVTTRSCQLVRMHLPGSVTVLPSCDLGVREYNPPPKNSFELFDAVKWLLMHRWKKKTGFLYWVSVVNFTMICDQSHFFYLGIGWCGCISTSHPPGSATVPIGTAQLTSCSKFVYFIAHNIFFTACYLCNAPDFFFGLVHPSPFSVFFSLLANG